MREVDWVQLAIIAFILIGIGALVWRGGAANPVGTGTLQHNLGNVRANVNALTDKVKKLEQSAASKENVEEVKELLESDRQRIEARFADGSKQMHHLDDRLGELEVAVGKIETAAKSNQVVIEAMAESLRVTNGMLQDMRTQVEANSQTIARVPAFIERVLTELATNAAETKANTSQVDRLYHFLTEKALK